jgi:hypothetical protein
MRLLPELGLLRSDPLFDRSYPKSGSELTETTTPYVSRASYVTTKVRVALTILYTAKTGRASGHLAPRLQSPRKEKATQLQGSLKTFSAFRFVLVDLCLLIK